MTHTSAQFELSVPLAYIETTIPSGITIDEYRRSRPQRRSWWHWLRRARGPSGMLIEDYGLIGNLRTALLIPAATDRPCSRLSTDEPAFYNIVDDEPAPVREWLPALADALGAKPPRRFPCWLARLFAGEAAVVMATESRGASNAKAKRELGWKPRYSSWRHGFAAAYAPIGSADQRKTRPPRAVDAV